MCFIYKLKFIVFSKCLGFKKKKSLRLSAAHCQISMNSNE